MSIDLSKLTGAPWYAVNYAGFWEPQSSPTYGKEGDLLDEETNASAPTNAVFIALARNAFDVMMRRGWWVVPYLGKPSEGRWFVRGNGLPREIQDSEHPDPFTALVEADAWHKANVEKQPT
jgi:hypothetical protein